MCGIAAIFSYGGGDAPPVDRDELRRIRERMVSRGPDGEGEWISPNGRVGLGHRRLSIIDLSPAGAQPMFNGDRSLAIVFNGEIYNYRELRSQLAAKGVLSDSPEGFPGYQFRSHCDTEVLLALYEQHSAKGQEHRMLNDLRGMYAFAIWDEKRQCLFAARDPFGIKPLYYSDNGHTFRLASQVKALRAGGAIDLAPDPAGHVGFFLWGHVPDPFTMFRNIRTLPAGHSMRIGRSGAEAPRCFCSISSILAEAEKSGPLSVKGSQLSGGSSRDPDNRSQITDNSLDTRDELLRSALSETVKYHLVADVPVGVFLSSGLDSTMITALAAEQGGDLRTVTLGFEEYKNTPADEVPLAEEFAKRCGAKHQTIWVSRADFEAERSHLFEAMDRPSTDGVNTFFVSLAAKQAKLKVALSGVGGDELFAGYPSFHDIPRTAQVLKPFASWPSFGSAVRFVSAPILKRFTSPKYAGLFEYGGSYSGAYLLRRGMFMPWELPELLDPDFVKEGWAELQTLLRLDETLNGIRTPRLKVSALEMDWYMRHQLLRDSDWAGMGHSVEIRVPFVDVDLLRHLAPVFVHQPSLTKRDVARVCVTRAEVSSSEFEARLLDRPKTGFQVPVRDWLMSDRTDAAKLASKTWSDRGLRGWAKYVYQRFPNGHLATARSSERKALRAKSKANYAKEPSAKGQERDPSRLPLTPSRGCKTPKRILVFRIGQLGDTIVALPAMWAVRKNFPEAHIALLYDRHPGKTHVIASDLLRGSKIFDDYLSYPVSPSDTVWRKTRMAGLLTAIRARRFDTLVYLAPTSRTPQQIERDRRFFSMAGILNFIAMSGFEELEPKRPGQPFRMTEPESNLLLRRLAASGLSVSAGDESTMDLGIGPNDEALLDQWLKDLPPDGGRDWIAIGPGSKMPAKRWQLRRFEEVVHRLINEFEIWPVIFGGEEDKVFGDWLLEKWSCGYNAAGALGIRSSLAAMQRCRMFLGNDTGTMHMAAAVGLRCVAVFSSRERPGLWYPHGTGHRVFRSDIECEGCGLVECLERENECLNRITTDKVLSACRDMLAVRTAGPTEVPVSLALKPV
jgi:asparagine synthase (glutamine-hydrolysing)